MAKIDDVIKVLVNRREGKMKLGRGLGLSYSERDGYSFLRAGREGVPPSDNEMRVLINAVDRVCGLTPVLLDSENAEGEWIFKEIQWPTALAKD